jgi:CubicO group peptidase (beta-lactamase class C family)
MVDTTFAPSASQWERMVGMHDYKDGKAITAPTVEGCVVDDCPVTHPLGGGGLISTMDDYIKFAQMLQNKGMTPNGRILDEKWIEEMARPQLPVELMSESVNQGLGVRVITGDGYPWLADGTFGWSGAYGTHFWIDPVNQITAIYMKNSRYDGGSGAITGKHFEEDVFSSNI